MQRGIIKLISILSLLFLGSCVSDKPDIQPEVPISTSKASGVFIINEGNFQYGNSSVSYYNFSDGKVTEDVFQAANKRPLGDVCQSINVFDGKAYVVVNNSGKIEIVDPNDFSSIGVIQGLTSPRYFLGVTPEKAYVTDLFGNAISVIDLTTNKKVKEIPCAGWTEELLMTSSRVFVTNIEKEYLYVVDISSDKITDSIQLGKAPNSLQLDRDGKLWVLCRGKKNETPGSLHRIDPVTLDVEVTLPFANSSYEPWRLRINGSRDTLYYLNDGVYQLSVYQTQLPAQPLISPNGIEIWGLGIQPDSGIVYVSDAIDYIQKGKVYRYKSDGTLINSFQVGITPGEFYFY
ncbi:MAG TPA: DUF5074 domain-containing protein [Cytophagaceae bacterium]